MLLFLSHNIRFINRSNHLIISLIHIIFIVIMIIEFIIICFLTIIDYSLDTIRFINHSYDFFIRNCLFCVFFLKISLKKILKRNLTLNYHRILLRIKISNKGGRTLSNRCCDHLFFLGPSFNFNLR